MEVSIPGDVLAALSDRYGPLVPAGAGAWSAAFRIGVDDQNLIVRVGEHVADFRVDAEMSAYSSPSLPIPTVIELVQLDPPHDRYHACVSTFAPGEPLEECSAEAWATLAPAVADMLETMRTISPADQDTIPPWPEVLLGRDTDDTRLDGWQDRLSTQPDLMAAHHRSIALLREKCELSEVAGVTPSLLHCDLINRNVHVADGTITGIFDWGCRRWGDHLYDLAWFEFWAPWHPNLDVGLLRSELISRWGEAPDRTRLTTCLLHIGADHLVYHAAIDNEAGGREVLDRMTDLGLI